MISILGCGWLGLPLAELLISEGKIVKGSTHTLEKIIELEQAGIKPFYIDLSPGLNENADLNFFDSEILIINIPPKRREDIVDYHKKQFESLISIIENSSIKKVLFISSTSVYPDVQRVVTEEDATNPDKESGKALLEVEKMLMTNKNFRSTILRFSGLIGYDRHPGRFLAGKKELKNGNVPVNLIHRDDCIAIINEIINKQVWGEVFNGSADRHPKRKEYYIHAAQMLGLQVPEFVNDSTDSGYKIVSGEKLKARLNYVFKYPDPMNFINEYHG